jgi:outer membrane lipoprotein-sorting protein
MKRMTLMALLVAAAPLVAAESRELHFKTEMSGAGLPQAMTSETWIKGEKVRMEMETPIGPSTTVIKDKVVYSKTGSMAMKIPVDMQKNSGPRPTDWATAMDQFLKNGKKIGTETVDGEMCDKWHITKDQNGKEIDQTVWISPSLQFPRKTVTKSEKGELTMHNRDIEKKVSLDASKFEPEAGVNYMDMTEMMKNMQKQQPH